MQRDACLGATAGAIGGIVGSWAMIQFNHLIGGSDGDGGSHPHRRVHASPNETDGTISDEPASEQVASLAAEPVLGRPLGDREKKVGGSLLHYAFGAAMGAIYGAAAERDSRTIMGAGLPFGAAVWVTADELALPALGLAQRPFEYPPSRHASALGSHLVFGLTVEAVRRALRGRPEGLDYENRRSAAL